MYNNPYVTNYNSQIARDRIDNQIAQLQQMKEQIPPMPSINQTFQLAPNNNGIRYAENIEDVNKEMVFIDTPFFSKDMSVMWLKNNKNEIKTYSLEEIIQKDEKDLMIESLQMQLKEMKGIINNAKSNNDNVDEPVESKKSSNVSNAKSSNTKSK